LTIRVLSVPAGHVYVAHLSSPDLDDGVVRLPDVPVAGNRAAAPWWPPAALDAERVREHHREFDLAHVHFGFDAITAEQLQDWVDALRECGKPLVFTVHDLRNPHHVDPRPHDAALDVLVPAATSLITLTPGAAAEIERRWGRRAAVLPHPHVVEEPTLSAPRPAHDGWVVGVHLKSLRAGMDPAPVVEVLAKVVPQLPDARLQVNVHTEVMIEGTPQHDPVMGARLHELARDGSIDLRVHEYFGTEELWDYFLSLDVSVLAYRFGTHSGWLEACHDLGTTVLASDCGFYGEQEPCLQYHLGADGLDVASLENAVRRAYDERPQWRADPGQRRLQRQRIAAAHRDLYAAALAEGPR
jgi:hypothetical protein